MGRLWQSLILVKWNLLFANLPIEILVYAHQSEYYQASNEPAVGDAYFDRHHLHINQTQHIETQFGWCGASERNPFCSGLYPLRAQGGIFKI